MTFKIDGKFYSVDEWRQHVDAMKFLSGGFKPSFIVIHNTASPSLAQRKTGFTAQQIENLRDYYANKQHWSGGPHAFIDDKGVWGFNPLDDAGVHSPSYNTLAWGLELLGDYATESATSGRGLQVVKNAAQVTASLLSKLGLPANSMTIKFHKEDPKTNHDCPGKLLVKADFIELVRAALDDLKGWKVLDASGKTLATGLSVGQAGTGAVRAVVEALGGTVDVTAATRTIVVKAGN